MELLQLKYFQIVALNEHITRSAEQLYVSQPTISGAISRLEQELGVQLFTRAGRNIELNDYGKVFLNRVNKIFMEIDNSKKEIDDMKKENSQLITLSVTSPQFLHGIDDFIKNNPLIRWQQSVKSISEIEDLMNSGLIEISITSPGYHGKDFESVVLLRDRFMIATHPSHPLAKKKSVCLTEISNEKFIALHEGLPFREQTNQLFAELGIIPNIIMECDHSLRGVLLDSNMGITISTQSAKHRHIYNENICFIPIKNVEKGRDIVLTWKKGYYFSDALNKLKAYLIDYYADIGKRF